MNTPHTPMRSNSTIQRWLAVSALALAIPFAQAQAAPSVGDVTSVNSTRPAAERPGPRHVRHPEHGPMRMLEKLNLSAEQKAQVKTILDKERDRMKDGHEARRAQRDQMKALVQAERFDRDRAAQLIQQEQGRELQDRLAMLQTRHDIYTLLTPEQRSKLQELETRHEREPRGPRHPD